MALQNPPSRRGVVRSVAALLGASLAGCTSRSLGDAYSSSPEDTPISEACERDNQELPDLWLLNRDGDRHVVDLTVTLEGDDGTSETFYERTFDLAPDEKHVRAVAFDPDEEDLQRYEEFVAIAASDDGQTDSEEVSKTVVEYPLRYSVRVSFDSEGEISVMEMHWDYDGETTPAC